MPDDVARLVVLRSFFHWLPHYLQTMTDDAPVPHRDKVEEIIRLSRDLALLMPVQQTNRQAEA